MLLEIKKAEKLYYVIAKDQYLFSDDAVKYYKLTVALDRLKDTVKILNGIKLNGRWNENAVNFVLWINYADLLVACIDEIAKSFSIGITYEQNIFWGYHGLANKTDKDFFRFIRAIVLPHALQLDDNRQKEFTNGQRAFCPRVVWDKREEKKSIKIVYYNAEIHNDLHTYNIAIEDIEKFIVKCYGTLDFLIETICKMKNKQKGHIKNRLKNEFYNYNATTKEKCRFLKELTVKYGDINDKAGRSFDISMLDRCERILNMKFSGRNRKLFIQYRKALDLALDDYYDFLCQQSHDEKLLDLVLFPHYDYTSKTDFEGLGYSVNKIITELENFDSYVEMYDFPEYYEELKPCLSDKATVTRAMSMDRVCYLVIMSFFMDKVKYVAKYQEAFSDIKN